VLYFLSLFRAADMPEFADRQICLLRQTLPLLEALVSKHFLLSDSQVNTERTAPAAANKPSVAEVRRRLLRAARHLTPREAEVVAMITLGHSAEAISDALGISVNTVCTHRKRSYAKLGIDSQSGLFSLYFELS
jgi:DNA-binding CsgD family transcriptional regulator